MPHMKHFQDIGHIQRHYEECVRNFNPELNYGLMLLETWGIYLKDKQDIIEEKKVLDYLLSCQLSIAHGKENIQKPSLEVVNRCFNRHLAFLEKIHGINQWNVNKLTGKPHSKMVVKEYKACRHYLFKFSLPAWYEKLPNEILTFKNKYPNFGKEKNLPIPQ